jgi:hypothetical protein
MNYFDDAFLSNMTDETLTFLLTIMAKVSSKIMEYIKAYLSRFDLKKGRFDKTTRNRNLLNGLQQAVEKMLTENGYLDELAVFKTNFETISKELIAAHLQRNALKVESLASFEEYATARVMANIAPRELAAAVHTAIRQNLFDSVNLGRSLMDAYKATEAAINVQRLSADLGTNSMLETYAHTATRDAYYQYDGLVNGAIATKYGLDAFIYTGSIVAESRLQCKTWTNVTENGHRGVILIKDLPLLIQRAYATGSGMIHGTTADNFMMYRGGYNCRHRVFTVRSSLYHAVREAKYTDAKDIAKELKSNYTGIMQDPQKAKIVYEIKEIQGFNGLGKVVDKAEFDRLMATGEYHSVARGVTGKTAAEAQDFINSYKNGTVLTGSGIYGQGVYFDMLPGFSKAQDYAGGNKDNLMYVLFPKNDKDAKIGKYNDLYKEMISEKYVHLHAKTFDRHNIPLWYQDVGAYSAVKGYDGYIVYDTDKGLPELIIHNRTKTIILQ